MSNLRRSFVLNWSMKFELIGIWKSLFANWKRWSVSRSRSPAPWRPRTFFSLCSFWQARSLSIFRCTSPILAMPGFWEHLEPQPFPKLCKFIVFLSVPILARRSRWPLSISWWRQKTRTSRTAPWHLIGVVSSFIYLGLNIGFALSTVWIPHTHCAQ